VKEALVLSVAAVASAEKDVQWLIDEVESACKERWQRGCRVAELSLAGSPDALPLRRPLAALCASAAAIRDAQFVALNAAVAQWEAVPRDGAACYSALCAHWELTPSAAVVAALHATSTQNRRECALRLGGFGLGDPHAIPLLSVVSSTLSARLCALDLSGNRFGACAARALVAAAENPRVGSGAFARLADLDLSSNAFDDDALSAVLATPASWRALRRLALSYNDSAVGPSTAAALGALLSAPSGGLDTLELCHCGVDDAGARTIAGALMAADAGAALRVLRVDSGSRAALSLGAAALLAEAVAFRHIALGAARASAAASLELSFAGAAVDASTLDCELHRLADLRPASGVRTNGGAVGARAVADAGADAAAALRWSLSLRSCELGDAGAATIARALARDGLIALDLSLCGIGLVGASDVLVAASGSRTLISLSLCGNPLAAWAEGGAPPPGGWRRAAMALCGAVRTLATCSFDLLDLSACGLESLPPLSGARAPTGTTYADELRAAWRGRAVVATGRVSAARGALVLRRTRCAPE
jgi:hypothetical protein